MPFTFRNSIITKAKSYMKNGLKQVKLACPQPTPISHLGDCEWKGLWRSMVKNPNSPRNRFRHQKTVRNERSLLRVRQEAYTRFKSEGAGDHLALVKAINFVGLADTSSKQRKSRHKRTRTKRTKRG